MYSFQTRTDISKLSQFKDHKVELSIVEPNLCFMFQKFAWKYDDMYENLILYDQVEDEAKVFIPLVRILEITNLTDDIYCDVVDICTEKYELSICSMEQRHISPICNKCGKDLLNKYTHSISLDIGYGSRFDGIAVHRKYCDDCIAETFGLEVEVNG